MAGLLLEAGEIQAADEFLLRAYELADELPAERRKRFAVTSTATALYRARLEGDVAEALSAARLVLQEHWDRSVAVEVRALTLANVGIAEFWADETEHALEHLQAAAGLALEFGSDFVLFIAESYLAAVDARQGRLGDAHSRARTAIQLAERRGWSGGASHAIAYVTLATVHLWWNELDEAERAGDLARDALGRSPERLLAPVVAQIRAHVQALRGDPVRALDLLRSGEPGEQLPGWLRVSAKMIEADLWMALGEPARARKALATIASAPLSDAAIGVARLELALGEPDAAMRTIADFLADDREALMPVTRTEAWAIDAIARDAIHDEAGALRAMERALDLAEPRGYSNAIIRHGAPVRSLLRRRIAKGTAHRAFAGELLSVLEQEPAARSGERRPLLLEPLSERELTVLRFLPTMMSNAEIAAEMFVSVNTVKTHLKHIYRKLDVSERRDAVRRGRELRLLSPGLDRVVRRPSLPGEVVDFGERSLRRFLEIEGAMQATVLAAQAFTSLIPFMVVAGRSAPGEGDLSKRIIERFDLAGSAARSVDALFNSAGEVESAVTWVSIAILVLSATSFTRALQRMFQRAYATEPGSWRESWRGLAWLAAFGRVARDLVAAPKRARRRRRGRVRDLGVDRHRVRRMAVHAEDPARPNGLAHGCCRARSVSAVLGALLGAASGIYIPIVLTWSADRYGLIGVAFTIQSWLLAAAFVVVVGAVIGGVASERVGERSRRYFTRALAVAGRVALLARGRAVPALREAEGDGSALPRLPCPVALHLHLCPRDRLARIGDLECGLAVLLVRGLQGQARQDALVVVPSGPDDGSARASRSSGPREPSPARLKMVVALPPGALIERVAPNFVAALLLRRANTVPPSFQNTQRRPAGAAAIEICSPSFLVSLVALPVSTRKTAGSAKERVGALGVRDEHSGGADPARDRDPVLQLAGA